MTRRVTAMILSALIGTVVATAGAPAAEAAGAVRFTKVHYNPAGSDTGSNTSLNAEWVTITNHGAKARNLTGWVVKDPDGHRYKFGTFHLAPSKTVKIHTGKGTDTGTDLYWGSQYYVWNNDGDKAILKNRDGRTVDTCKWDGGGSTAYC